MSPFVAGKGFWDQLTSEQQKAIIDTSREMVIYGAGLIENAEKEALENLKKAGVNINEVDLTAFENSVRDVISTGFPEWSPNLYKNVQEKLSQY